MLFAFHLFEKACGDPAAADAFARNVNINVSKTKPRAALPITPLARWSTATKTDKMTLIASEAFVCGVSTLTNNIYRPITLIQPSIDQTVANGSNFYAAHYSNKLEFPTVVYIDKQQIEGVVLGITSKAEAVAAHLWHDDHDLRIPYPKPISSGEDFVEVDENGNNINQLPEYFSFTLPEHLRDTAANDQDGIPVLCAVPTVIPFAYQDVPPSGGFDSLIHNNRIAIGRLDEDSGTVIADVHISLITDNNGASMHTCTNFNLDYLDDTFRAQVEPMLVDNLSCTPTFCDPLNNDATMVRGRMETITKLAINNFFDEHPDKRNEFNNLINRPRPNQTQGLTDTSLERLCSAIMDGKSSDNDDISPADASFSENFHKILLMKSSIDPNNPTKYVFNVHVQFMPIIHQIFKGVKNSHPGLVMSWLSTFSKNAWATEISTFYGISDFVINRAFLVLLQCSSYVFEQWNTMSSMARTTQRLSVFCFTPMDNGIANEYAQNIAAVTMESLVSQNDDHKTKIDTKIYCNYNIKSWSMATSTLVNFNIFLLWLSAPHNIAEYDGYLRNPTLWPFINQKLNSLIRLMRDHETVPWAKQVQQRHPWLGYSVIMAVQNWFARLCSVAQDPALRMKVLEGIEPIHSEAHGINSMVNTIEDLILSIKRCVDNNDAGRFINAPLSYETHCPPPKRKQDDNNNNNNKRQRGDNNNNNNNHNNYNNTNNNNNNNNNYNNNNNNNNNRKGGGHWSLVDPNVRPNFTNNKPPNIRYEGKEGKPCGDFMIDSRVCTRRNCFFIHPFDLSKCSNINDLCDYVDSEPTLKWLKDTPRQGNSSHKPSTSTRPSSKNKPSQVTPTPSTPVEEPTTSPSSNDKQSNVSSVPSSTTLFQERFHWNTAPLNQRQLERYQIACQRPTFYDNPSTLQALPASIKSELILLQEMHKSRRQDAARVPPPTVSLSTSNKVSELHTLSSAYRKDATVLQQLSSLRKTNQKEVWQPRKLPDSVAPADVYPNKSSLLHDTNFGKPHLCKSYIVEPSISQVSVILFKSGFLDQVCSFRLARALPNGLHALSCVHKYHRIDFRALRLWPLQWDEQTSVNKARQFLCEACLFYYDMDTAAVQRFCNGRFTGQHRRTDQMIRVMQHILPSREFWELVPSLIDGIPNQLTSQVTHEEYVKYRQHGNMPNLATMPELVDKGIAKEDARHLSLIFDQQLLDFIPHVGLIAMGIINPKYKKPRIYRHGSLKVDHTCHPINSIVDIVETEPAIECGTVVKLHCTYLWRLAAAFPNHIIDSYDDDISGAFPQMIFHPDVARANVAVHEETALLSTACHFGGNFGPPDWEPYARARCYVASFLFDYATYQVALNQESLDLMEFPCSSYDEDRCRIVPQLDDDMPSVVKNGKFSAEYRMYVDDLLSACIRQPNSHQLLAASSIEAVYLLLGYPGPIKQPFIPPSMAWDKMEERPIGPDRVSLGLLFDGRNLTVSIEDRKVQRLLDIIHRDWNRKRKMFTVLDAAILIGNVIACMFVCAWLKWSLHHLSAAMQLQLKKNARRLRKRKGDNRNNIEDDTPHISHKIFKIRCFDTSFAREIWRMKEKTAITSAIYEEVDYIALQCHEHLNRTKRWQRPISHIVDRRQDAFIRSDASTSWGAGGGCATLDFWWQLAWTGILPPPLLLRIQSRALSINVLEMFGMVIGAFAAAVAFAEPRHQLLWQPRALLEGDNTTAESWHRRFTNDSTEARLLTRMVSLATKQSGVGFDVGHVEGALNYFSDAVSRGLGSCDKDLLATLPPVARAIVGDGLVSVANRAKLGTAARRRKLGTAESRAVHYVRFATEVLDLEDPQLVDLHPKLRTFVLIVYCSYLCRGHTLKNILVREATIRGYVDVAVTYIKKVTQYDVRLFPVDGKPEWQWEEHPLFETMLLEVRRWQSLERRAEGLSKSMIEELIRLHHSDSWDSFGKCLIDWLIVAIHTGYRRIEWCQKTTNCSKEEDFQKCEDDPSTDPTVNKIYAVTQPDIMFVDSRKRAVVISLTPCLLDDTIHAVRIRWRYQKNGKNGQTIHFARNPVEPSFCIVLACLRIIRRHRAWGINPRFPLAVYKRNKGSRLPSWFGKATVQKKLQALGNAVYGTEHDPPLLFTVHSPRVGAAMLLHAAGEEDSELQQRLRWESDSFRVYLRDVPLLALRHTQAITATDVDCFLWSAVNPTFEEDAV